MTICRGTRVDLLAAVELLKLLKWWRQWRWSECEQMDKPVSSCIKIRDETIETTRLSFIQVYVWFWKVWSLLLIYCQNIVQSGGSRRSLKIGPSIFSYIEFVPRTWMHEQNFRRWNTEPTICFLWFEKIRIRRFLLNRFHFSSNIYRKLFHT